MGGALLDSAVRVEREEQVLSTALAKAAKAFERNPDLEHDYLWTFAWEVGLDEYVYGPHGYEGE